MRPLTRIAAAGTAALALVLAPVGVAMAAPSAVVADDSRQPVTLTDQQRSDVIAARKAYIESATTIKRTYRTTVGAAMDKARAQVEPQALAVELAKDAYRVTVWSGGDATAAKASLQTALDAYKAAWSAAKASVQGQLDAAKSTAKAGLDTAKATYQSAMASIFGSADAVPRALQNPPGSWSKGMGGMDGWGNGDRGMGGMGRR